MQIEKKNLWAGRFISNKKLFWRNIKWLIVVLVMMLVQGMNGITSASAATTISFTGAELVGLPTDSSVVINIIPNSAIEYYYEYGKTSGALNLQTGYFSAGANEVSEVEITGLDENTEYYYRLKYHAPGDEMDDWVTRDEHSFWTQRPVGNDFTFTITSDIHDQSGGATNFGRAINNIALDNPDFHVDLGDTFMVDGATSQSTVNTAYLQYRATNAFGLIGADTPIFLSSGNHEEEEGWNLDDTPFSIGVGSIQARKMYYPTPIEGDFYTGNIDPLGYIDEATYGDELREDYYAWEWGDALFVVIDPFQYTMELPYSPGMAGEGYDDSQTGDQWTWTLGETQFGWLKNVLQTSNAKYKFVFSHQMVGGIPDESVSGGAGYVRGGAEAAGYFEWGGLNANGTEGFAANRDAEDFGSTPIHQMFLEYGVSAYFHGHDHQYVYERRDNIVYQEMPSAGGMTGFSGIYSEGVYDDYETISIVQSPGYLRLSVGSENTLVEYVSSASGTNGTVMDYYTIEPNDYEPPEPILGDVDGDEIANSTDALIVLSGDVGIDISMYCPINCGDVNGDELVNSLDALIILRSAVGLPVVEPIGSLGCYADVVQPSGCSVP